MTTTGQSHEHVMDISGHPHEQHLNIKKEKAKLIACGRSHTIVATGIIIYKKVDKSIQFVTFTKFDVPLLYSDYHLRSFWINNCEQLCFNKRVSFELAFPFYNWISPTGFPKLNEGYDGALFFETT